MGRRNSNIESYQFEVAKTCRTSSSNEFSVNDHLFCKRQHNKIAFHGDWGPTSTGNEQPQHMHPMPPKPCTGKDKDEDATGTKKGEISVAHLNWLSSTPRRSVRMARSESLTESEETESEESVAEESQGLLTNTTSQRKRTFLKQSRLSDPAAGKKPQCSSVSNNIAFAILPSDSGDLYDSKKSKKKLFRSHRMKLSSKADRNERKDGAQHGTQTRRLLLGKRSSLKQLVKKRANEGDTLAPVEKSSPKESQTKRANATMMQQETHDRTLSQNINEFSPGNETDSSKKMETKTTYDFDDLIPYSKGGCAKSKLIRFGVAETTLRLRKKIDLLLRLLGEDIKKELCLHPKGICYFGHDKFVIVVEVPNESNNVFIYSMLHRLSPEDNAASLMYKALTLNYMQQETRGACISMDEDEFTLSFSAPVDAMDLTEFRNIIGNFVELVVDLEKKLMEANAFIFMQAVCPGGQDSELSEDLGVKDIVEGVEKPL